MYLYVHTCIWKTRADYLECCILDVYMCLSLCSFIRMRVCVRVWVYIYTYIYI